MAISGDFSTSNQYIKYRIVVNELSTSVAENVSVINVKVQAWRTNTGYETYGSGTCYCNIDGANYSQGISSSQRISYNSYTTLFDQNATIPHAPDGSRTIYVSAYISHSRFTSNSQGFNVALSNIPRQANLTAAPNFYDVDNPTITYSNPAGNAVSSLQACISLTGSRADIAYRDISKTGTSYTFNLTQAERNVLLAACPNSNTLSVKFYVKSVISGQTYYSILDRTMTVKNANPTFTGASYSDINSATTAITQNNQLIIQNNSTVQFKLASISALKYATLTNLSITVNGVTTSSSLSGTSVSNKTVNLGTINSSNNLSANFTITDSRGNKTSSSINISMLAWSLPTAIISLKRKSNYYDETYLSVNADYSSLNNHNSITIQYQYKQQSGSSWSALTTIQDETIYTLSLDNTKAYDFRVIVTDRIGSTTYNKTLQIGIPIIFFDRLLNSVGVGTIPSEERVFETDRKISLKNNAQQKVADLWSWRDDNTGNSSARLYLYNQNGTKIATYGSENSGGALFLYNQSGTLLNSLYCGTYGGALYLYNQSGDYRASMYVGGSGGGGLTFNNANNTASVQLFTGNAGDGVLNLFNSSGSYTINLSGQSGVVTCVSVTQTSSRKVKNNIKSMDPEEARKILDLEAVSFDYKNKDQGVDKRGFIAEDVADIIPQLVSPETKERPATLDYIGMIPYLQAVIKQQDKQIQELKVKLDKLT